MKSTPTTIRAFLLALLPAALFAQEIIQLDTFEVTAQKCVQPIDR